MKTIYEKRIKLTESVLDSPMESSIYADDFNALSDVIHRLNNHAGWWHDIETGKPKDRNVGELLMLIVSEIGEAMEADRKDLMDDKLPHRKGLEVELADAMIRILDFAGAAGMDIGGAIVEKLEFNLKRSDHKPENRAKDGGKKY